MNKEIKLEPLHRLELESELAIMSNLHVLYIRKLSDEELLKELKGRK